MIDTPLLGQRQAAPAPQGMGPSDDAVTLSRHFLPGNGPRIKITERVERGGVFAKEKKANEGADRATMKWISELLHTHYRGHLWAVAADHHQGVGYITIPVLLPRNWGW